MRILWVKSGKMLPIDTGGKIRSYNILRQLIRSHEVTRSDTGAQVTCIMDAKTMRGVSWNFAKGECKWR